MAILASRQCLAISFGVLEQVNLLLTISIIQSRQVIARLGRL